MRNAIAKWIVEQNKLDIEIDGHGREVVGDGIYKVEWTNGEDGEVRFDLYSNGEWDFEDATHGSDGRSMPPHSKRWVSKLVKLGYALEVAKAIWSEWMSLKWQADDSKKR